MKTVSLTSNQYFYNDYSAEQSTLISSVFPASASMSEERYKQEISGLIALLEQHKPKKVVGNMKEMFFPISPEIQKWLDENLFACYAKIGLKKLAIILSNDLFTAVSIEQTIEDVEESAISVKYFDDLEKGLEWCSN